MICSDGIMTRKGRGSRGGVFSPLSSDGGLYHLVLRMREPRRLRVGSLGWHNFPAGFYVYTGSARRGLVSRVRRHHRREKVNHWHIDWLTRVARIEEIWLDFDLRRSECRNHGRVLNLPGARTPVPGFGSSDCRCPSHLAHFVKKPTLKRKGMEQWQQELRQKSAAVRI
jgi:Uri superfamily endonuclease